MMKSEEGEIDPALSSRWAPWHTVPNRGAAIEWSLPPIGS